MSQLVWGMNAGLFIVGVIVNVILLSYVVPWLFPIVTAHNKASKSIMEMGKIQIPIVEGPCPLDNTKRVLNTVNPGAQNYIFLPDSNNLIGGAQFSYTFWINLNRKNLLRTDKIIFMRGIFSGVENDQAVPTEGRIEGGKMDENIVLTKCPLVRFAKQSTTRNGPYVPTLDIEFNTLKNPHNVIHLDEKIFDRIPSSSNDNRWYMFTMVFKDHLDARNQPVGAEVLVYLNDSLVKTHVLRDDAIKVNHGNFVILPGGKRDIESFFANITYYNYALDIIQIQEIYNNRLDTNKYCTINSFSGMGSKATYEKLSQFAKLQKI